ncbi:hypothetical protein BU26DRAFT_604103 [Trematosphaeria pertusa]|uniref:F-box domain-containing protein n=1 Tax=Trematosphaeria pertusa TaxID=390896 RepID=A0A6A6IHY6_9PLEO|nr:uncharacterized protein BU26DRAFT_604103 [Trematosphaeria pertusa]KAF2249787.1 hypothetical protein BU26DRAFT_604103 [Trematosphaeria pertusa]
MGAQDAYGVDGASLAVDLATLSMAPKPVGLLSLPGELRNRIYHFCVESYPIYIRSVFLPRKPQFIALTRVCRQIREEFLPMFLKKTKFVILPAHFKTHGDITLLWDAEGFDYCVINLTPVIHFLFLCPWLRCEFKTFALCPYYLISEDINKLLAASTNEEWRYAVLHFVSRICLKGSADIPFYMLDMSQDHDMLDDNPVPQVSFVLEDNVGLSDLARPWGGIRGWLGGMGIDIMEHCRLTLTVPSNNSFHLEDLLVLR